MQVVPFLNKNTIYFKKRERKAHIRDQVQSADRYNDKTK